MSYEKQRPLFFVAPFAVIPDLRQSSIARRAKDGIWDPGLMNMKNDGRLVSYPTLPSVILACLPVYLP